MVGRRRGRTGRGWDAAPPRRTVDPDEPGGPPDPKRRSGGWPSQRGRVGRGEPSNPRESADPGERAREICLRLLAVRPRTRAELATALKQRGIDDTVAAEVLARYGEVGMIDDQAFARAWVSSRHHGRGLARRALAAELRRKGVDSETVGVALGELDPETEAATARALVERKLRTERGGATEALLRRLVGMLARKGYSPALAVRVARDALAQWPGAEQDVDEATDLDQVADALESEASLQQFDGPVDHAGS
jgi:regulatory protein